MSLQQFTYHVDLVLVMDATMSMTPVIDQTKKRALGFHDQLDTALDAAGKRVDQLRIRVVVFRDLAFNRDRSLVTSPFFGLPAENEAFADWVKAVKLEGNDTNTESGLAGLSVAMSSPWTASGDRRRHVVVLWTDDDAHLPEKEHPHVPAAFADAVASTFDELTDRWHSSQYASSASRRLVLFAPDTSVWQEVHGWENCVWYPSQAGSGLADIEMDEIMASIVNSI
jgi:hypothetical protein